MDRLNPSMVLMTAVSETADDTDFKVALVQDPPMDLGEFFHEAERFLQQKDAQADKQKVNTVRGERPSGEGSWMDKGKRKLNDGYNRLNRQWKEREPKFSSYQI